MTLTLSEGACDPSAVARTLLGVAAEVEAAEARIKQAILDAAAAGDCDHIVRIVKRWQSMPAVDVLADGEQGP